MNGKEIEADSSLQKYVKGKRLQEWVGNFPQELRNEFNTLDFDVDFYGMELDWDELRVCFSAGARIGHHTKSFAEIYSRAIERHYR